MKVLGNMRKPKQYAVVTRVSPVREDGRIRVHTYGPYDDINEAKRVQYKTKRDAVEGKYADRIEVSVCTLL